MNDDEKITAANEAFETVRDIVERYELPFNKNTINALVEAYQAGLTRMHKAHKEDINATT